MVLLSFCQYRKGSENERFQRKKSEENGRVQRESHHCEVCSSVFLSIPSKLHRLLTD